MKATAFAPGSVSGGFGIVRDIVEEHDSIRLVPPDVRARVDGSGNLVLVRPDS